MILGLSISAFTTLHVVITLIAIASGFVVMFGMLGSHRLKGWTAIFWLMTVLTSVTGFLFPLGGFTPALGTGVVATVVFVIGLVALYGKHLTGSWRWIYAVTAVISLYLNVFVLIVQSFEKVGLINPRAPQFGPPFSEPQNTQFAIAQGVALLFFVAMGIVAAIKFRPAAQAPL
ncbi:MAG: hypothetical protein WDN48_10255 [Pseudolabrys sp.]